MTLNNILFSQNWIISAIFIFLTLISVFSWYLIFRKIFFFHKELKLGQGTLSKNIINNATNTLKTAKTPDLAAKKINISLQKAKESINSGQNFLASIATLTPFIGLFGTVLGVYFALIDVANEGSANIAVVARPIGEALIATAMGLWCAIPASFAYNFFAKKAQNLTDTIKIAIEETAINNELNI